MPSIKKAGRHLWESIAGFFRSRQPPRPEPIVTQAVVPVLDPLNQIEESQKLPTDVSNFVLKRFDAGVFGQELVNVGVTPIAPTETDDQWRMGKGQFKEGTYSGTQLALTEMYSRIERAYVSWFDVIGVEPTIPQSLTLAENSDRYQWSTEEDYPPHLKHIPCKDQQSQIQIFTMLGLLSIGTVLPKIVPKDTFLGRFSQWLYRTGNDLVHETDYKGPDIADVEEQNLADKKSGTDIMRGENIGIQPDWWSDARFAQQSFTGTNPMTIKLASDVWIAVFIDSAKAQGRTDASQIIQDAKSRDLDLYIQDASYFREAIGVPAEAVMVSKDEGMDDRFQYASVTLLSLDKTGKLHPLAIILDWRGSLANSVVVFNKRLQPFRGYYDMPPPSEKTDWPWRFAKTAAQSADWIRHEFAVHLTNTHFIEEATIVAANRTLPPSHPVYKLLEPHWFRTLSLNAAARATLVPSVIIDIVGFTPKQCKAFINHAFRTFDFVGNYVPNDLSSRGFPPEELGSNLNPRYQNYLYARNMILCWNAIRAFVAKTVQLSFVDDYAVSSDDAIQAWSTEARSPTGGTMSTFPLLKTKDSLIDAITMCIHLASPQHTSINYLQSYYQSFVIARPPSLYCAPPTTLEAVQSINEYGLIRALPIHRQREWLLASQIPWLLSFKVADEYNLLTFAASLYHVYKEKKGHNGRDQRMKVIAEELFADLRGLITEFARQSAAQETGSIPYAVLDPANTAVSILI